MATYTEKLGLKLPSQTDFYNVDDFNENFRKIDQNTAQSGDIQQVLTLADPIRSNRAPTTADAQFAGKLWVVPKMIFNNMMPDALTQVASNWRCTASTSSASGSSATIVGDGTASTIVSEVDMTAVRANDIVYINAKMAVTADANGAIIELLCGDNVIATTSMSIPTAGDSTQLIDYIKVDEAGALKLRVTTMYNSASAQLGKGVTISDITILDLTADMCQNFAGIEFTKDETTAYINTYGMFQTKTYELSEYWWICRGSYGGQHSWQRYDDEINNYSDNYQRDKATTTEAQAGSNDSHWMTPLKVQQFLTNKLATQAEAQTGSDNTKVMTPLRVANQITAKIATQAEAQAGSVDTKIMTPLKTQQFFTNRLATQSEADTGTSTTKAMTPALVKRRANPYYSSNIGDVIHTANNAEVETNGAFIKVDGRTIDRKTGYPLLANTYELGYRVADPTGLTCTGHLFSADTYYRGGAYINGVMFFIAQQAQSSSSSYYDSLCIRATSGAVTRLLSDVTGVVACQGQAVACTNSDQKITAAVYNTAGTKIRQISLNTSTSGNSKIFAFGNRTLVLYWNNGYMYSYYSDDNFATYGTSTWAGAANTSSGYYPMNHYYGRFGDAVKQDSSGNLYIIASNSNVGYQVWKSTDKGASWTKAYTLPTSNTDRVPSGESWFISGSYLYVPGYFNETSGSNTYQRQCLIKYQLSNGTYVSRTLELYSSATSYLFGFIQNGYAYLCGEYWNKRIALGNMAITNWYPSPTQGSSYMNMRTGCGDYLTKNGKYWLAWGYYTTGKPSYGQYNPDSTYYGMILVYDTTLHRGVWVSGALSVSTNSHCYLGEAFEDDSGNVYIPHGYINDGTFYQSKIIKIDFNKITLPELDYAYLKAKEMT